MEIGDKVKIIGGHYPDGKLWDVALEKTGTIIDKGMIDSFDWKVQLANGDDYFFSEDELQLIEEIPIEQQDETKPELKSLETFMKEIPITKEEYIKLAKETDQAGIDLMLEKSKGYSVGDDFLSMENRIAALANVTPEFVSMILACKHIASLFILLEKSDVISLEKWQERILDGTNLLKIASCFVHARLEKK